MLKQYKNLRGFTLVELMIVIIIIAILATIGIAAFGAQTRNARDSKRVANADSLSSALEVYYAENGAYPSRLQLNDQGWRDANLTGLSPESLKAGTQTSLQALSTAANNADFGTPATIPVSSESGIYYAGYNGTYNSTSPNNPATNDHCNVAESVTAASCQHFMIRYAKESLKTGETNPITISSRQ